MGSSLPPTDKQRGDGLLYRFGNFRTQWLLRLFGVDRAPTDLDVSRVVVVQPATCDGWEQATWSFQGPIAVGAGPIAVPLLADKATFAAAGIANADARFKPSDSWAVAMASGTNPGGAATSAGLAIGPVGTTPTVASGTTTILTAGGVGLNSWGNIGNNSGFPWVNGQHPAPFGPGYCIPPGFDLFGVNGNAASTLTFLIAFAILPPGVKPW